MAAANIILDMVEKEVAELGDPRKVFLGGMSMGGTMTFGILMKQHKRWTTPIGGFFVLSGAWNVFRPDSASDDCGPLTLPP